MCRWQFWRHFGLRSTRSWAVTHSKTRPTTRTILPAQDRAFLLTFLTLALDTRGKKKYPLLFCLFQVFFIIFYPLPMDKSEVSKTITTILNGHNYVLWSQNIRSFLKKHSLWRYVTGEIQALVRSKDEETRISLIVLKTRIARITKSSLGFVTLLYFPFISNLVFIKMLRMFGIFWVVIIPLSASLKSIHFGVFLSTWNKCPNNRSMSSFLVCSLFRISWSSQPILSRILHTQQS